MVRPTLQLEQNRDTGRGRKYKNNRLNQVIPRRALAPLAHPRRGPQKVALLREVMKWTSLLCLKERRYDITCGFRWGCVLEYGLLSELLYSYDLDLFIKGPPSLLRSVYLCFFCLLSFYFILFCFVHTSSDNSNNNKNNNIRK